MDETWSAVMLGRPTLALFSLLLVPCTPPQERAPGVRRVVYVLEVDLARAREVGWAAEDASDAQVVENAAAVVNRRLEAMERSFQLRPDPEKRRIELSMPQIQGSDRELFVQMLESLGIGEFLIEASPENTGELGIDLDDERIKQLLWRLENPSLPIAAFPANAPLSPDRRILWFDSIWGETADLPIPVLLPGRPEDHLGAAGLSRAYHMENPDGDPSIGVEFDDARAGDFDRLLKEHAGQRLCIVLEGRVQAAPVVKGSSNGSAMIEGSFNEEEARRLALALREKAGPLSVLEIR